MAAAAAVRRARTCRRRRCRDCTSGRLRSGEWWGRRCAGFCRPTPDWPPGWRACPVDDRPCGACPGRMNPPTGWVTGCGEAVLRETPPVRVGPGRNGAPGTPRVYDSGKPRHSRSRLGRHEGVRAIPSRICLRPGTRCPEDMIYNSGHTQESRRTGRGNRRPVGCPVTVYPPGHGRQRMHQGRLRDERDCSPNTGPRPRSSRRSPSPAQPTTGGCRAGSLGTRHPGNPRLTGTSAW